MKQCPGEHGRLASCRAAAYSGRVDRHVPGCRELLLLLLHESSMFYRLMDTNSQALAGAAPRSCMLCLALVPGRLSSQPFNTAFSVSFIKS